MIEVYFDTIHNVIIQHIESARKTIKICVAWFTDTDIYSSILKAQKTGVIVKVIIANHEFNVNSRIDFKELLKSNGSVYFIGNIGNKRDDKLMHNKFCIIDSETVITGSYNWTYKARMNEENILVINDKHAVLKFDSKFESIKPQYGFSVANNDEVHLLPIDKIMIKWDVKNNIPKIETISKGKLEDIFNKF